MRNSRIFAAVFQIAGATVGILTPILGIQSFSEVLTHNVTTPKPVTLMMFMTGIIITIAVFGFLWEDIYGPGIRIAVLYFTDGELTGMGGTFVYLGWREMVVNPTVFVVLGVFMILARESVIPYLYQKTRLTCVEG